MAKKYPRKPDVVEAVQYDGTNAQEIITLCPSVVQEEDGVLTHMEIPIVVGAWMTKDLGGNFLIYSEEQFPKYYNIGGAVPLVVANPP